MDRYLGTRANMEPAIILQLHRRIAALETQLEQAKARVDKAEQGSRWLLDVASSNAAPGRCDIAEHAELLQEATNLRFENGSLKDQITSMRYGPYDPSGESSASTNIVFVDKRNEKHDIKQTSEQKTVHHTPYPTRRIIDFEEECKRRRSKQTSKGVGNLIDLEGCIVVKHDFELEHKLSPLVPAPIARRIDFDDNDNDGDTIVDNVPSDPITPFPNIGDTAFREGVAEWADAAPTILAPKLVTRSPPTASIPAPLIEMDTPSPRRGLLDSIHRPRFDVEHPIRPTPHTHRRAEEKNMLFWTPREIKDTVFCRVVIDDLPANINYHDLLSSICGGLIVSCVLVDTSRLTGSHCALVRFHKYEQAQSFITFTKQRPLTFLNTFKSPTEAQVKLIDSPTYPLESRLGKAIEQDGRTRCLELHNFQFDLTSEPAKIEFRHWLRPHEHCQLDQVEHIETRGAGVVYVAFTSVQAADDAFRRFTGNRVYERCEVKFVRDPCDRPAELVEDAVREKANPDEIELVSVGGSEERGKEKDGFELSAGLLTPADSTSSGETFGEGRGGRARWDSKRGLELEMAAARGSPGSRG